MSQPRLFDDFTGTDPEYIAFLESLVVNAFNMRWGEPWAGSLSETPWTHEATSETSVSGDLEIVQYTPDHLRGSPEAPKRAQLNRGQKELRNFTAALLARKQWSDARAQCGIKDPVDNQRALRLMLGHPNETTVRYIQDNAVRTTMLPTENPVLVSRGHHYAMFIQRCADDFAFKESVTSFQSLIFISYCLVIRGSGISKETTNNMMRAYIVRSNDDKTLAAYSHGVMWVHRCIAELLVNGWGHRSWEIFLFGRPSLAQLGRFAAHDAQSYKTLVQQLGKADVPLQEEEWIPYCIPCIVRYLAGNIIGLERICEILGYGPKATPTVISLSKQFVDSIRELAGGPLDS